MNLDTPIGDAELSVRSAGVLLRAGFKTLRDIPRSRDALYRYKGLGTRSISEILWLLNDIDPPQAEVEHQERVMASLRRWESWRTRYEKLVRHALDNGLTVHVTLGDPK